MPAAPRYHRPRGTPSAEANRRRYEATAGRRAADAFYCSRPWRRLRKAFLAAHPLCDECGRRGVVRAAEHVHHVEERKLRPDLAMDWENLQALCAPCHGGMRKAADEPRREI